MQNLFFAMLWQCKVNYYFPHLYPDIVKTTINIENINKLLKDGPNFRFLAKNRSKDPIKSRYWNAMSNESPVCISLDLMNEYAIPSMYILHITVYRNSCGKLNQSRNNKYDTFF